MNSLKVTNYLGESITIEMGSPESSGLLLRSITGLSAPKADINVTDLLVEDGGVFNSSRSQKRNILLTILPTFFPTIEDSRHNIYRYFPIKKRITLEFETENRTTSIVGYVESNEIDIFSQSETAVISIICPQPYFQSSVDQISDVSYIERLFEFPFSNESLSQSLIEISSIRDEQQAVIIYTGDASTGVKFTIHFNDVATNITLYESTTNSSISINTDVIEDILGEAITAGDDIIISTIKGDKYAVIVHGGLTYNILNSLDRYPKWIQIQKGYNIFGYTADTGAENITVSIENSILYEGV